MCSTLSLYGIFMRQLYIYMHVESLFVIRSQANITIDKREEQSKTGNEFSLSFRNICYAAYR